MSPGEVTVSEERLPRFVPLTYIAEQLSISRNQAYALVRSGELPAIQVGGRSQWRVEITEFERYIEDAYQQARDSLTGAEADDEETE
jgi:excisionase family DNA binding protein